MPAGPARDLRHRTSDRAEVHSGGFGPIQPRHSELEEQHTPGFADQIIKHLASNLRGQGACDRRPKPLPRRGIHRLCPWPQLYLAETEVIVTTLAIRSTVPCTAASAP